MNLPGVKKKSLLGVKENDKKSGTRAPCPIKRKDRFEKKSKDHSEDKGATKESGRRTTRKRLSARSSSTSSSGSSTTTGSSRGSSSSSASSRSSTSRSSSSSSSSGSPSPSRRRQDNRQREDKVKPFPKPSKAHIGRLARNVTKEYIMEIFSTSGKTEMIDMPVERTQPYLSKGYGYVEFENPDEAEKALKHMGGEQIDNQEITATAGSPPRQFSPPRRMPPPPPMWHRSSPRMRRRSYSLRRRSPVRRQSRFPGLRCHRSCSSSNSS
uniref:RNA-binding protein with serine-rich domain 1 n=1 Tax=Chinchilla lanigera TaxID=34839 RepID=A0A8C2VF51_CHILA